MIRLYDFDPGQEERIEKAIRTVEELSARTKGFRGESEEFRERMGAILRKDSGRKLNLRYHGNQGRCQRVKSYTRGYYTIWICGKVFKERRERQAAVLFHEMVHACGGEELDAETLERVYFKDRGATRPDRNDFEEFESRDNQGRWFTLRRGWSRGVAVVYRKNTSNGREVVTEFPLP